MKRAAERPPVTAKGVPEHRKRSPGRCPLPALRSVPFPLPVHSGFQCPEVPMSRCFDSGFQCLGVPMSQGRGNLVELIKSWVASITTILHTTVYDVVTIRPVPPRQHIPCKDNTAIPGNSRIPGKTKKAKRQKREKLAGKQRGGCRTAAKASWLGVLSPSLREIASAPLGTRPCCPFHKSSAWKCGVKPAVRNFSWEPFDESSARILCGVKPPLRNFRAIWWALKDSRQLACHRYVESHVALFSGGESKEHRKRHLPSTAEWITRPVLFDFDHGSFSRRRYGQHWR